MTLDHVKNLGEFTVVVGPSNDLTAELKPMRRQYYCYVFGRLTNKAGFDESTRHVLHGNSLAIQPRQLLPK